MSWLHDRNGIWEARFTNSEGEKCRKSTGIKVAGNKDMTRSAARKVAQAIADAFEGKAKGIASERVIKNVQTTLETVGVARKVSPRAWFEEFQTMPEFLHVTEQQQKAYAHVYDLFCEWFGKRADAPITKVKSSDIVDFLNYESTEKKFAKGTILRHRSALSVAFNSAEHNELVARNPVRTIRLSMIANERDKEEILPFTLEQIHTLREKLPTQLRRIMLVCLYSFGQRLADCCRMKWSMFNMTAKTLSFTIGKTKRPIIIPLSKGFIQLLHEIKREQVATNTMSEYLFPQWGAKKYCNDVSTAFGRELRKLGMTKRLKGIKGKAHHRQPLCFHSLRHTVVSQLRSAAEFTPDIVRDTVGHVTEEAQRMYYSAPYDKKLEVAAFVENMVAAS